MLKKKKKTKIKLIVLAISILLITVILYIFSGIKPDKDAPLTYNVVKRDVVITEGVVGTIEYKKHHEVFSNENYLIKEIYVGNGDVVNVGDKLFAYDSTEIEEQISEYNKLLKETKNQTNTDSEKLKDENEYSIEKLNLSISQAEDESGALKDYCEKLREKLSFYVEENNSYIATRDEYYLEYSNLKTKLDALSADEDENVIADFQAKVDRAELFYQEYSDKVENYVQLIDETEKNITECEKSLLNLEAVVTTSKNELKIAGATTEHEKALQEIEQQLVVSYENKLKSLKSQLEGLEVYSSYSGVATDVLLNKEEIELNKTVMKISDIEEMTAKFELTADKRVKIDNEMNVIITTDASSDVEIKGTISKISSSDDGTYCAYVDISEEYVEYVRAGLDAYARIILVNHKDVLAVPYESIFYENDMAFVFKCEDDLTSKVKVNVELDSNYYVEITSEQLKENDVILLRAQSDSEGT